MAAVDLSPLARAYDHVLLDLDGCLWVGDEAVPGAPEALAGLRAAGRNIAFLTNDPRAGDVRRRHRPPRTGPRARGG